LPPLRGGKEARSTGFASGLILWHGWGLIQIEIEIGIEIDSLGSADCGSFLHAIASSAQATQPIDKRQASGFSPACAE